MRNSSFVKVFLRGLAVVLPIAVSGWLVWHILGFIDGLFEGPEKHPWRFPGLGLVATLAFASIVGLLAEAPSTKRIIEALEAFMLRIPVVKHLYGMLKDFFDAFLSKNKRFDKPVFVQMGGGVDAQILGFVTAEDLAALGVQGKVAVYVPQSYNIGGNLLILPRSRLTPIDADSASVMAFIVSGGVTKMGEMGADGEMGGLRGGCRG